MSKPANEPLSDRKILIGVSGGIAAYKTAALTSQLVQAGADCQVIMTEAAKQFVGPATFAALTGKAVADSIFDASRFPLGAHIELARAYELLVVAPATADLMFKTAQGAADDLLSTLLLCFTGTRIFAPAMNCEMWENAAVQRNHQTLIADGIQMVGPGEGWLSCRDRGVGRMAEPEQILEQVLAWAK